MKSHSSPANSTPVGPPPTTITLSSLSRSGEDLRHSPKEGPNENQDDFMHRQVSRTRGRGKGRGRGRKGEGRAAQRFMQGQEQEVDESNIHVTQ